MYNAYKWISKHAQELSEDTSIVLAECDNVLRGFNSGVFNKYKFKSKNKADSNISCIANTHVNDYYYILNTVGKDEKILYVTLDAHIDADDRIEELSKANVVRWINQLNCTLRSIIILTRDDFRDRYYNGIKICGISDFKKEIHKVFKSYFFDKIIFSLDCDSLDTKSLWSYEYQPINLAIEAIANSIELEKIKKILPHTMPKRITIKKTKIIIDEINSISKNRSTPIDYLVSEYEPILDCGGFCLDTLYHLFSTP